MLLLDQQLCKFVEANTSLKADPYKCAILHGKQLRKFYADMVAKKTRLNIERAGHAGIERRVPEMIQRGVSGSI